VNKPEGTLKVFRIDVEGILNQLIDASLERQKLPYRMRGTEDSVICFKTIRGEGHSDALMKIFNERFPNNNLILCTNKYTAESGRHRAKERGWHHLQIENHTGLAHHLRGRKLPVAIGIDPSYVLSEREKRDMLSYLGGPIQIIVFLG